MIHSSTAYAVIFRGTNLKLIQNHSRKSQSEERPKTKWEDNIKNNLEEVGYEDVHYIQLM
jgi:hypothetical protein